MTRVPIQHDRIYELFGRINYERQSKIVPGDFKLPNMFRLMEELGNVHLDCPVVHVAGTKGKGSVCAFIGAVLGESGFQTGIYTSPHLERINQRIVLDGCEITDSVLDDILGELEPHVAALDQWADQNQSKRLTFFEVITAAAFKYFSQFKADAIVLEVGMGGRLDSTNVCQPVVSVITNISLDHTKQLGDNVELIAAEKAGIIKPGIPVVSGVTNDGARQVIEAVSKENDSVLYQLGRDFDFVDKSTFDFRMQTGNETVKLSDLNCGMLGHHQSQNASVALAACQVLKFNGWAISNEDMRSGISKVRLPGRCEIVDQQPLVILDIAHNEAAMAAFAETLKSSELAFQSAKYKYLIFATSKEKDVGAMLNPLLDLFDEIILTQYQDNPRGRPVSEIMDVARKQCGIEQYETKFRVSANPGEAWEHVRSRTSPQDAVCVTGSAFLVAELRPILSKNGI